MTADIEWGNTDLDMPSLGLCCVCPRESRPAPTNLGTWSHVMEHWISIVRAVGDLLYLAAAVVTLTGVFVARSKRDR